MVKLKLDFDRLIDAGYDGYDRTLKVFRFQWNTFLLLRLLSPLLIFFLTRFCGREFSITVQLISKKLSEQTDSYIILIENFVNNYVISSFVVVEILTFVRFFNDFRRSICPGITNKTY